MSYWRSPLTGETEAGGCLHGCPAARRGQTGGNRPMAVLFSVPVLSSIQPYDFMVLPPKGIIFPRSRRLWAVIQVPQTKCQRCEITVQEKWPISLLWPGFLPQPPIYYNFKTWIWGSKYQRLTFSMSRRVSTARDQHCTSVTIIPKEHREVQSPGPYNPYPCSWVRELNKCPLYQLFLWCRHHFGSGMGLKPSHLFHTGQQKGGDESGEGW